MPKTNKDVYYYNNEKVDSEVFASLIISALSKDNRAIADYDDRLNAEHGKRGDEPYSEYEKEFNKDNYDSNLRYFIVKNWPDIMKDHEQNGILTIDGSEFRIERK